MNKFYLHINKEDELGEIIKKIKEIIEKEIILVIPSGTRSLLNPDNFEIFQKEVKNLDKEIYFDTDDEKIKNLARQYNFQLFLDTIEEKFFDIRPPIEEKVEQKTERKAKFQRSKFRLRFNFKKIFTYFLVLFSLSILGFVGFNIFQTRAEITIETKKMSHDFNEVITLKQNQVATDYDHKILPAEYIKVELYKTETIKTTGQIFTEEKPLLKVTFFNYLARDIPLVSGTRLKFNDNIFRTIERIIIPSANNDQPGKRSVLAVPFEIKDDNLKINKGSDLKIVVWEENKTKAYNGKLFIDVVKVKAEEDYSYHLDSGIRSVASQDITNVKLALEDSLKKAVASDLALKNPESFYLFEPDLVKVDITNISNDVGDRTDKISATGRAFYETMKIDKNILNDFIKNLINKDILALGKQLRINNLNFNKIELMDFDVKKRIMIIGIKGNAVLEPDIAAEAIKTALKGKSIEEAKNYFKIPAVEKVTIKIFPNWKEILPLDTQKIEVYIK